MPHCIHVILIKQLLNTYTKLCSKYKTSLVTQDTSFEKEYYIITQKICATILYDTIIF